MSVRNGEAVGHSLPDKESGAARAEYLSPAGRSSAEGTDSSEQTDSR